MKPHCLQNNDSKTHKLISPIIVNINTDLFGIFHRRHIFIGAKKVTVRFRGQTHFFLKTRPRPLHKGTTQQRYIYIPLNIQMFLITD
jgi:hypothetical protein